jgi:hypothetical protein
VAGEGTVASTIQHSRDSMTPLTEPLRAGMSVLRLHDHKTSAQGSFRLLQLRRAVALPLYAIALVLSFASDALGCLAARIAGDDWPQ